MPTGLLLRDRRQRLVSHPQKLLHHLISVDTHWRGDVHHFFCPCLTWILLKTHRNSCWLKFSLWYSKDFLTWAFCPPSDLQYHSWFLPVIWSYSWTTEETLLVFEPIPSWINCCKISPLEVWASTVQWLTYNDKKGPAAKNTYIRYLLLSMR